MQWASRRDCQAWGRRVALAFLAELRPTLALDFNGFTLRTFGGVQVTV